MEKLYEMLNDLRPEFDFHQSDNYIEDGYLDSFDIVALITEIESNFEIKIDGLDIIPDNFISHEAIVNLIIKSGGTL